MTDKPLRVGIIGASSRRGWASLAHIPAIKASPRFELTAVCTSNPDSARAAAQAHGARLAFSDYRELVAHPEVDVVVVAVKVTEHRPMVEAALDAGKHVYCEWPLACSVEDAAALVRKAKQAPGHAVVGLQGRHNPALEVLCGFLSSSEIGRILSSNVSAWGMAWGAEVVQANAYSNQIENGATMMSIPFAHLLDVMNMTFGSIRDLETRAFVNQPKAKVIETGLIIEKTSPDQIVASGLFGSEDTPGVIAIHYRGGPPQGLAFRWDIAGTEGMISVHGDSGHVQLANLEIFVQSVSNKNSMRKIFDSNIDGINYPFHRVQNTYEALYSDIIHGTKLSSNFEYALLNHKLYEFSIVSL